MIETLRDLYSSPGFQSFIADKLGNDLFINDPDRADRIHAAAENGCDGSTHAEVIEDWQEYLNLLDEEEADHRAIQEEIDACEEYHKNAGTLYDEIG